ncbi:hypothetical protein BGZ60DRAFT_530956 [Tricladium varicosporioides]|nr:hypothetical protein BGZ60DRAFT_530956 [Hymenoscyphus varicosporioides]
MDYLVSEIETDLGSAASLCREIRENRHVGHLHIQLDQLENSLRGGEGLVRAHYISVRGLEGVDSDGGDDASRAALVAYAQQVKNIENRLRSIASPPLYHSVDHHDHHDHYDHHHDRHHHHEPLLYISTRSRSHHDSRNRSRSSSHDCSYKVREEPHFHDLLIEWDHVRDGIIRTFSELIRRMDKKKQEKEEKADIKRKEKEAKEKCEEEKKTAIDKVKRDKEEEVEKIKASGRKALEKAEKESEKLEKKIKKEDHHKREILGRYERLEERRGNAVENLLERKINEDPLDNVDRFANTFTRLQQTLRPPPERHSHDSSLDQLDHLTNAIAHIQRTFQPAENHSHRGRSCDAIFFNNVDSTASAGPIRGRDWRPRDPYYDYGHYAGPPYCYAPPQLPPQLPPAIPSQYPWAVPMAIPITTPVAHHHSRSRSYSPHSHHSHHARHTHFHRSPLTSRSTSPVYSVYEHHTPRRLHSGENINLTTNNNFIEAGGNIEEVELNEEGEGEQELVLPQRTYSYHGHGRGQWRLPRRPHSSSLYQDSHRAWEGGPFWSTGGPGYRHSRYRG